ncbi:MAG TPA: PDZ domain-containing protein, partial [Burkholderiales bacterium]|nr:PDZ domain-containing protein [Burkholderiales bacterium]
VLWQQYGRTGIGVPEDGIARIAQELAGDAVDDFFARYVNGTEDPPLASLLHDVGMALHLRPQQSATDRGGKPAVKNGDDGARAWLGVKLAAGSEPRLQYVFRGGPAERAGLAAGDVLVAFDGLRASADALDKLQRRRAPGDAVAIAAFRRDELKQLTCTLDAAPSDTAWLALDDNASEAARAQRAAWLGTPTASRSD